MTNFVNHVWAVAHESPAKIALRQDDEAWTYQDLHSRSHAVANYLADQGVSVGDRVLLVQGTTPSFLSAFYGILHLGASAVLANVMATPAELGHMMDDAGVKLVLAGRGSSRGTVDAAGPRHVPVGIIDDLLSVAPPIVTERSPAALRADDDPAMLLYTSGTTGKPKGVVIGHGSLFAAPDSVGEVVDLSNADVVVTALPLFHVFGGVILAGMTLTRGATLSLIERFQAGKVLEVLTRDQASVYAGVPTMHHSLINHPDGVGREQFANLRVCISGAASVPDEMHRAFMDRYGAILLEGYGMTEMTGVVSFTRPDLHLSPGTVGVALRGVEVQVRRPDGSVCEPGEVGELFCRGSNLMLEYNNLPEATADAIREGWYASGDLVTMDASGVITVVGRIKELIIRGGYNVYPREVEEVLLHHPEILEVAVVGVPDGHYGQEIAAMIVTRDGEALDPETLRAWAKERLSAYKVPRLLAFVNDLPKGATGKIDKRAIGPQQFAADAR